jgi:hypothetical protein
MIADRTNPETPTAHIAGVFAHDDYEMLEALVTETLGIQTFSTLPSTFETSVIFFRQSRAVLLDHMFMTIPVIGGPVPSAGSRRGVSVNMVRKVGSLTAEMYRRMSEEPPPREFCFDHGEQLDQYHTEIILIALYGLVSGLSGAIVAAAGKDLYEGIKKLVKQWRARKKRQNVACVFLEIGIEVARGRLIVLFNPDLNTLDADLEAVRRFVAANRDKLITLNRELVDLETLAEHSQGHLKGTDADRPELDKRDNMS